MLKRLRCEQFVETLSATEVPDAAGPGTAQSGARLDGSLYALLRTTV